MTFRHDGTSIIGTEYWLLHEEIGRLRYALRKADEALTLALPAMRGRAQLTAEILGEQAQPTIEARGDQSAVEHARIVVRAALNAERQAQP